MGDALDLMAYAAHFMPQRGALLKRAQLPDIIWQIDKLMSGARQPRDEVERDFVDYHRANPHVFAWFNTYTHKAIDVGKLQGSAWHVVNGLRWEAYLKADDPSSEFTICNDYIGIYARWWMERNREHLDFFSTKLRKPEAELVARNEWRIEPRVI